MHYLISVSSFINLDQSDIMMDSTQPASIPFGVLEDPSGSLENRLLSHFQNIYDLADATTQNLRSLMHKSIYV